MPDTNLFATGTNPLLLLNALPALDKETIVRKAIENGPARAGNATRH
jgi:hypothetical protein